MSYPPPRYTGDDGEVSAAFRPHDHPSELANASGGGAAYLATGASTHGQFGLYRWDMGAKQSGPDPHFHKTISESFYVLRGQVRLHDGSGWVDATAGDFLYVPEGGIHGFRILFAPGAPREDYFETLADAARREAMDDEARRDFYLRHDTYWI
jgi:mannose-6-phosphate isomerase-like protein (cupin superfamily)